MHIFAFAFIRNRKSSKYTSIRADVYATSRCALSTGRDKYDVGRRHARHTRFHCRAKLSPATGEAMACQRRCRNFCRRSVVARQPRYNAALSLPGGTAGALRHVADILPRRRWPGAMAMSCLHAAAAGQTLLFAAGRTSHHCLFVDFALLLLLVTAAAVEISTVFT